MKKLNLSEQQLDKIIKDTVKKYITEQHSGNIKLLKKYLDTAMMKMEKIKRLLQHPDAKFLLGEDDDAMGRAIEIVNHTDAILQLLESEFGSFTPNVAAGYNEKEFSEPVKVKKKSFSLNEKKTK